MHFLSLSIQGRAGLLPFIDLSGSVLRNSRDNSPDYSTHGYTLALTQPLVDVAAWQNYEQSKLSVTVSEAAFSIAQQDLMMRVAQRLEEHTSELQALMSISYAGFC